VGGERSLMFSRLDAVDGSVTGGQNCSHWPICEFVRMPKQGRAPFISPPSLTLWGRGQMGRSEAHRAEAVCLGEWAAVPPNS